MLERPGVRYALERFGAHEASALVVADVNRLAGSRPQLDSLLARLAETGMALVALEPELDTSTEEGREVVRQLEIVRSERAKLGGGKPARPRGKGCGPQEADPGGLRERVTGLRDEGESLQGIADALGRRGRRAGNVVPAQAAALRAEPSGRLRGGTGGDRSHGVPREKRRREG